MSVRFVSRNVESPVQRCLVPVPASCLTRPVVLSCGSTGHSRTHQRHGNGASAWPGGPSAFPLCPLRPRLTTPVPGAAWGSLGRFERRRSPPWPRRLSCSGRRRLQRACIFTCYRASGGVSQMTCPSIHWCVLVGQDSAPQLLPGQEWARPAVIGLSCEFSSTLGVCQRLLCFLCDRVSLAV